MPSAVVVRSPKGTVLVDWSSDFDYEVDMAGTDFLDHGWSPPPHDGYFKWTGDLIDLGEDGTRLNGEFVFDTLYCCDSLDKAKSKTLKYPQRICSQCAAKYCRRSTCGLATWHDDTCGICGNVTNVTEPRDFGHLTNEGIKMLATRNEKG